MAPLTQSVSSPDSLIPGGIQRDSVGPTGHRSAGPPLLSGGTQRTEHYWQLVGWQATESQPTAVCFNGSELTQLPIERSEIPHAGHHNLTSSRWPQFCVQPSGGQRKPAGAAGVLDKEMSDILSYTKRRSLTYGLIIISARPN
jgi:hypothetical protein